jgi:hypothetical protein
MSHCQKKEAIPGNEAAPLPDLNSPTEEPRTTSGLSEPAKRAKLILRQKAGSAPFCWQRKAARKLIRKACDGASLGVYVLSVYDGLTELASDAQVDAFQRKILTQPYKQLNPKAP